MTKASMSRKMVAGPWLYSEVKLIAELLGVTTDELAGVLPSADVWRARRDSNSQPSDWESGPLLRLVWSVKAGLTPESRTGDVPARHLAVVA